MPLPCPIEGGAWVMLPGAISLQLSGGTYIPSLGARILDSSAYGGRRL